MTSLKTLPGVAVLTRYDSRFGATFMARLAARGFKPGLVVIEETPIQRRWKQLRFLARRIGWTDAVAYNLRFWKPLFLRGISGGRLAPLPDWQRLAPDAARASDINNADVVAKLREQEINLIVLAQSGIVRRPILEVPSATINCHPGRLPFFRGVDVVRWALWQREQVWVTLHLVDAGVDTGSVLEEQHIPVMPDDCFADVARRADDASVELLLRHAIEGVDPATARQQDKSKGRQYYLMPRRTLRHFEGSWPLIRDTIIKKAAK